MVIELDFVFSKKYLCIPNVFINDIHECFMDFFKWMDNEKSCIVVAPGGTKAYSYDEYDFVRYIDDTIAIEQHSYWVDYSQDLKVDGRILFD